MKSLMEFEHINAATIDEAVSALRRYGEKAWILAGGTDVIGTMRFEVLRNYPEVLINLKTIPGMDYIREEESLLKIGALTRLQDIAMDATVKGKYGVLSEAAGRTASPHVREMGTIGGNICQLIRCWYFRKEDNRFDCIRKGGKMCHAMLGDNRYHSIYGAVRVADTPCTSACPANVDIPAYLSLIREGDLPGAAGILLNSNPLPSITGRVCPHYCEQDCNRSDYDEAISIRSIERFMGDYILENAGEVYQPPRSETGKSVAIVGSGPAGLSAAYYLRKLGHSVTVFEPRDEPGGILTYGIPPYRLQKDVVKRQIEAIESLGIQFTLGVNIGGDTTLEGLQRDYDAVFCATGAWEQPSLGIEDEELLTPGLEFLTQVNRGLRKVSAKSLLVIGGGKVAIDVAVTARRLGVKQVTLACLECREEMPASGDEVEQAVNEGIDIMPSWGPYRVLKDKGKVSGMELVKCASVYDSEGNFSPTYDRDVKQTVEVDQVVLATGQKPDLSFLETSLEIKGGYVAVSPNTQATNIGNVFAGGDVTSTTSASVSAAIAAGRRAAQSINRYFGGEVISEGGKEVEPLTRSDSIYLGKQRRVETPERPNSQISVDTEDVLGLDLNAVEIEAKRCFNCGCEGVNPSDMAPALVALDAQIVTTKRTIKADEFWAADKVIKSTILEDDEIITEIRIPKPKGGAKSAFIKFAMRRSIDFPIVNCAAVIESTGGVVKSARICLNAVYSNPYRVTKAEDAITGKSIDEASAEAAGVAAVSDATALPYNKFKIQIAKTLVKRVVLACK
jgi:NADPH-dependent glutamate synthase beta subunit-like oxidoreductase